MKKEPYVAPVMEIVLLERGGTVVTSGCNTWDCGSYTNPNCPPVVSCPTDGVCPTDGFCPTDGGSPCGVDGLVCPHDVHFCTTEGPGCSIDGVCTSYTIPCIVYSL